MPSESRNLLNQWFGLSGLHVPSKWLWGQRRRDFSIWNTDSDHVVTSSPYAHSMVEPWIFATLFDLSAPRQYTFLPKIMAVLSLRIAPTTSFE